MRVAAGLLFCLLAAINIFAGMARSVEGGLLLATGVAFDEAMEDAGDEAAHGAGATASEAEGVRFGRVRGGLLVIYGVFLLGLAGMEIVSSVFLFKAQKAVLIGVVAGLEALADGVAIAFVGSVIFPLMGLVAAAIGGMAAYQLRAEELAGAD